MMETSPASLTADSHQVNPQCRSHFTSNHTKDQYDTQTPHARSNLLVRDWNVQYGIAYTTWVTKPTSYSKVPNTYMRRPQPDEPRQENNGSKVNLYRNVQEQQTLQASLGTMPKEVTLQCWASNAIPQECGLCSSLYKGLPTSMTTLVGQVAKARQPYNTTHAREAHQTQGVALRPQILSSQCRRIDLLRSVCYA